MRSTMSAAAPTISQAAPPNASAGSTGSLVSGTARRRRRRSAAHQIRSSAGASAARFHGITGPIAIATNTGTASGSTVALKNGAPTLSLSAGSGR